MKSSPDVRLHYQFSLFASFAALTSLISAADLWITTHNCSPTGHSQGVIKYDITTGGGDNPLIPEKNKKTTWFSDKNSFLGNDGVEVQLEWPEKIYLESFKSIFHVKVIHR